MKKRSAHIISILLMISATAATLSGCIPSNGLSSKNLTSGTGSLSSGLSSNSTDGAKSPCTLYDTSDPTRAICVSCYQSILTTRCPNKADFSLCVDPLVKTTYTNLINQCISASISAGFTCTRTCSAGQVLNASTCTCVAPPPVTSGSSGTPLIDTGQTNFGPPVVTAGFLPGDSYGTNGTTSCSGTAPLYMGVLNRGDTVFRLNQYSKISTSTQTNQESTPKPYLASATTPVALTPSEMTLVPGANVKSIVGFRTGGRSELLGAPSVSGSFVSTISTVSGANSNGVSMGGDNGAATDATWTGPGFGARDQDGNIYFSDPVSHVVRVICYQAPTVGVHPFCTFPADQGKVHILAGTVGSAGYSGDNAAANTAKLNSPHGIAVDSFYNVYIADSGNHIIRVVCGTDAGNSVCAIGGMTPGAVGFIYKIVGTANTTGPTTDPLSLNYPYGVDVALGGLKRANIYIADQQNHAIRVYCGFAPQGPCDVATGNIKTLIGNGSAGYTSDGTDPSTNTLARNPTDVKINWMGNLIYADTRNHLIRAICTDNSGTDFCAGVENVANVAPAPATPTVKTIAGFMPSSLTPLAGDAGSGAAAASATLTYPTQLLIGKQYADDVAAGVNSTIPNTNFRDNNILFTERLFTSSRTMYTSPVKLSNNLSGVTTVAMGKLHTCVTDAAGDVRCLGDNTSLQIGDASATNPQPTLKRVVPSAGHTVLASGAGHSCSFLNDPGTEGSALKCWGGNASGQLGNDNTTNQQTPVPVINNSAGGQVYSGTVPNLSLGDKHGCVLSQNGEIYCWGDNSYGQLGDADPGFTSRGHISLPVSGLAPGWTVLASGANHSCAYASPTKQIRCWGANSSMQLSNGTASSATPVLSAQFALLVLPSNVIVSAGGDHTCASFTDTATGDSAAFCWGSNIHGESGSSTIGSSVSVSFSPINSLDPADSIADLAVGIHHSCALTGDKVKCWGSNIYGQLGNDEVTQSSTPVEVIGLPGTPTRIFAGGNQTCALVDVGTVTGIPYCWGSNSNSQLGNVSQGASPSGNMVRIICGDNTNAASSGFCKGVTWPSPLPTTPYTGTIFNLSGRSGVIGGDSAGDGANGRSATFAKVTGLTYDRYKNLIVSSGGITTGTTANPVDHFDYNLRLILGEVAGPQTAAKYSFSDSNSQTSYYCMRLKPMTYCDSSGTCSCRAVPPTDSVTSFWQAQGQNESCN